MKYGEKDISDLDDNVLLAAYHNCGQALKAREEASQHPKFTDGPKRMEFPPPNPKFIEMKNEIENEMKKRKLLS